MPKQLQSAKKPLSWFLIITMINTLIVGAVLSFDFQIKLPHLTISYQAPGLEVARPEAIAADTATTSVEVENTAPYFVGDPAENPAVFAASPVNMGGDVTFQATAEDDEWHNYYLIVCSTNAVTAVNGGEPTCGAIEYCTSVSTAHNAQATCTHNTANELSETYDWYAFVCDVHPSQSKCSLSSQGSGNSGSPYIVNHPPVINSVVTTVDNQAPGGTFTFTTDSYDPDALRADTLVLYVCDTNSGVTYGSGCNSGNMLCNATNTAVADISCNYTDTAPTDDSAYSYYAYIFDNLQMYATTSPATSTYTIINVAPTVASVTLNGGALISPQLKGQTAVQVSTLSMSVTDNNYCTDLTFATATIYMSNAAGGAGCAADGNNCYQIASTSCQIFNCSGSIANAQCTTSIEHFITPTDASESNPNTAQAWHARIGATDDNNTSGDGSFILNTVDVQTVSGLEVTQAAIDFGTLRAGTSTKDSNATTTVINYGNSPLRTGLLGQDMTRQQGGGNWIGANQQEWSLANFLYGTGTDFSSTTQQVASTTTAKPTSSTDVTDDIYWGILVPALTVSGNYYGLNTFSAMLDPFNW